MHVPPETKIKELRAQLSPGSLPMFHAVVLHAGGRLLGDDETVAGAGLSEAVPLQVVATTLPAEALLALERYGMDEGGLDCDAFFAVGLAALGQKLASATREQVLPAMLYFRDNGGLDDKHCEKFLTRFNRNIGVDPAIDLTLAEAFAHACENPEAHVPQLRGLLQSWEMARLCAAVTLAEIHSRSSGAVAAHSAGLVELLSGVIGAAEDPDIHADDNWITYKTAGIAACCRLIGAFGDAAAVRSVSGYATPLPHNPTLVRDAAATALAQIATRHGAAHAALARYVRSVVDSESSNLVDFLGAGLLTYLARGDVAEVPEGLAQFITEEVVAALRADARAPADHLPELGAVGASTTAAFPGGSSSDGALDAGDTDTGLEEALQQSEIEALHEEQQQVHYALLRSKADSPPQAGHETAAAHEAEGAGSIVLLHFGRRPRELNRVLLGSPLAARLSAQGVNPQPDWAGDGRLVLLAGVDPGRMAEARTEWHVAVRQEDEGEVYEALRSLGHDMRPRLKKGNVGRSFLPQDASCFDVSEACDELSGEPSARLGEVTWQEVPVSRTFLHVPADVVVSPRTCVSAPPQL